jgi:hypothetical protein
MIPRGVPDLKGRRFAAATKLSWWSPSGAGLCVPVAGSSSFCDHFVAWFLAHLLCFITSGIVRCMPSSRAQQPAADLFWAAGAQEPCRIPEHQTSAPPSAAVVSSVDKSSPRYVLPRDLSNALQQLGDLELDRLLAATRHELQRRGRLITSAPEIRPASPTGAGERVSKPSIAIEDSSERRQSNGPNTALTLGQMNAVRATFKAGITPSRIAKQFGISQSDVRKVLASEFRRSGSGR